MHKKCGVLGWICLILVIIGGINWGLIGLFSYNLVANLLGEWPAIERIVYILVGIASIILIFYACFCCARKGECYKCHGSPCSCKCGKEGFCSKCQSSPCRCRGDVVCDKCHSSPCRCNNRPETRIPPENRTNNQL